MKNGVSVIHSKSEDRDPKNPAKKIELSANLSKNATKWPKNGQKLPKMVQSGPNMAQMAQNYPKWPKNDARIYALFPQFFFD